MLGECPDGFLDGVEVGTSVDHQMRMALVAVREDRGEERIVDVARCLVIPGRKEKLWRLRKGKCHRSWYGTSPQKLGNMTSQERSWLEGGNRMFVWDRMSSPAVTITPETSWQHALNLM
jgi:hypothetical protein